MLGKKINTIVEVEGMRCENCAKHVTNALKEIKQVKDVKVNLEEKTVSITSSETIDESLIKEKIESQGYSFIGVKGV